MLELIILIMISSSIRSSNHKLISIMMNKNFYFILWYFRMLLDEIMEQQRLQNKEVDEITRQINKIKLNSDQRTDGNNCSC